MLVGSRGTIVTPLARGKGMCEAESGCGEWFKCLMNVMISAFYGVQALF